MPNLPPQWADNSTAPSAALDTCRRRCKPRRRTAVVAAKRVPPHQAPHPLPKLLRKMQMLLVALLLLLLSSPKLLAAEQLPFCSNANTITHIPESTYKTNLLQLAENLIADVNVTKMQPHSANSTAGKGADMVYGAVLCRGDSAGVNCADRLQRVLDTANINVTSDSSYSQSQKSVTLYDHEFQALLRFSDQDFLTSFSNTPECTVSAYLNPPPDADSTQFSLLFSELMKEITANMVSRRANYWTGRGWFERKSQTVYGLVQCMDGMLPESCRTCLGSIIDEGKKMVGSGLTGGAVLGVRCSLWYQTGIQFFAGDPEVSLHMPTEKARFELRLLSMAVQNVINLWRIEEGNSGFSLYDFAQIKEATKNFSRENKLGQGGFGPVYKGILPGGLEVAVKRLSACSVQGLLEFKNEIQLIAKLQHKNLVKLLGCCIEGEHEKMLVYEYMQNRSLDAFIFDFVKGAKLNWSKRLRIIDGIAQGILYLHCHSRLCVVHRDLKASNILLDSDMTPKISDFGMARIFCSNMIESNTTRIVGTHGYISPEYAFDGVCSIKSDVFSFGVLVLEIISGKRTADFYSYDGKLYNLISYAWQLWRSGQGHELVCCHIGNNHEVIERCIQVALLCVQERADDRPSIDQVVTMLNSEEMTLPKPKQPAYFYVRSSGPDVSLCNNSISITLARQWFNAVYNTTPPLAPKCLQLAPTMRVLFLLLLLAAAAASSPAPAAGDDGGAAPILNAIATVCNSTAGKNRTFQPNSTFESNLHALFASLTANASASGYAASSLGAAPDTAYGLVLCRGDSTGGNDCTAARLDGSLLDAVAFCGYSRDVTVYHDQYQLRYSDRDFLAGADNSPEKVAWNMNNVSDVAHVAEFDALVAKLVNAVADRAASNGSSSLRSYAAGTAGFAPEGMTVYAMAQCTPDLSPEQCRGCLAGIIGQMPRWFSGRVGGRILGVRCDFRYEKDLFFKIPNDMIVLSPLPDPSSSQGSSSSKNNSVLWIVAIVVPVTVLIFGFVGCFLWIRSRRRRVINMSGTVSLPTMSMEMEQVLKLWRIEESGSEFMLYDFDQIAEATDNFSDAFKLGQGGFGPVYKGQLPDGLEIAIKRLSSCSVQGLMEFKTEIQLIAKLQHTNLVRLLGCCVQADEKMLIYEYMHNKSLDCFIFDAEKGATLNWEKRFRIIDGIAQGLLYLHKHSRLRVIHRDLKASNILLDREMNPKISDFGMARIFCSNVTEANTTRVVGTHGYIAPEYASEGLFSIKSDVFSFGVLLLEIISGKRTAGFYQYGKFFNLTGYAYQLWQDGQWHELVDPALGEDFPAMEVMKCVQVALLCVQDSADERPNMSDVIAMLGSEGLTMPEPRQPAYFNVRITSLAVSSDSFGDGESYGISNISLVEEEGR
uniref:non-specific serine/threonine protein kinase n=1 Tax=Leersia perrieri TaxID=77586 RepID=A0A0D9WZT9_9ORYZ